MQICPDCGEKNPGTHRLCGYCSARLGDGGPTAETRRTVTIVYSDLKGSTALGEKLDPESLVEVLAHYFDAMRLIMESHGGTVEKIIGDAIFAVFGLGTDGGDDAMRAVRAAAETQSALAALNEQLDRRWGVRLVNRTGVATGEVVVATASAGEHLLIGDVIQLANKLEQSAPTMEVLIGEPTYRIVADKVTVVPADPVIPNGSIVPVPAHRLVSIRPIAETEEFVNPRGERAETRICSKCGEQNPLAFHRCGSCGAHLVATPSRETRKTVTIVFADLRITTIGGEPLVPEVLKGLTARAFEVSRQRVERHGGTVAKFIGDAVMAVFGLPVSHEDDALRAVRSALDMRAGLATFADSLASDQCVRLDVAIGVNTGDVVAGHASVGQSLAIGDAVNVAARLEQAAGSREILLGPLTHALVRDLAEVEEIAPLTLKGKSHSVRAYRLLSVRSSAPSHRRQDQAMVGREAEMALLYRAFESAAADRVCRMVTLIGDAGVGKTRLTEEFLDGVGNRARILRGRCLPYGEGITFWPIVLVAAEAAGIQETDKPEAAREKLRRLVDDDDVADRVAAAVGLLDAPFQVAELFWGIRRFFAIIAKDRPLVILFDDIHWAEPTFLDLIGRLISSTDGAPVMLLCAARYELLEKRPSWGEDPGATRIVVTRLSDSDATLIIENLLGGAGLSERAKARVISAAEGNPLFVEQLVSMLIDTGMLRLVDGRWERTGDLADIAIPPTIHALLAARLDQLPESERAVVEPASVIGLAFAQVALQAIVGDDVRDQVPDCLEALEQRQLVHRQAPAAEEALEHRFAHMMIRPIVRIQCRRRTATLAIVCRLEADDIGRAGGDRLGRREDEAGEVGVIGVIRIVKSARAFRRAERVPVEKESLAGRDVRRNRNVDAECGNPRRGRCRIRRNRPFATAGVKLKRYRGSRAGISPWNGGSGTFPAIDHERNRDRKRLPECHRIGCGNREETVVERAARRTGGGDGRSGARDASQGKDGSGQQRKQRQQRRHPMMTQDCLHGYSFSFRSSLVARLAMSGPFHVQDAIAGARLNGPRCLNSMQRLHDNTTTSGSTSMAATIDTSQCCAAAPVVPYIGLGSAGSSKARIT